MQLRQTTTCAEPAVRTIECRSRKAGRALEYRLLLCDRHRWLARSWPGRREKQAPAGRCGTLFDHRDFARVVESHGDQWLMSLTTHHPRDHDGDVAAALRAAQGFLGRAREYDRLLGQGAEITDGIVAALDHAARVAEALADGTVEQADGRAQLLAALSTGEAIAVAARGA
ncbi:hypothetical protein AB0952_09415 [Streptomyces caniferus]|uniref:hypothetical protein n=1 Tax=Streptomyces caniferus TaxID=285557 RepID=UPI0034522B94